MTEKFSKSLDVFCTRLEKLQNLCASPEKAPPLSPVTPAGLLRLPFEIRLQIYYYCIPRKRVIEVSWPRFYIGWPFEELGHTLNLEDDTPGFEEDALDLEDDAVNLKDYNLDFGGDYWNRHMNRNSIFLLSRQISEEALDILYGDNIFKLYLHGEGEYYLKKNFTEANGQRMRYLLLIAQPMDVSYEPEKMPDNALWSSILQKLRKLRIVAKQPIQASYYDAPTLEQEMDCWVKWIKPFLQCFGQHLSSETIVQVDGDGQAEISELVKECLPDSYREVRCRLVGDLIFKRGRFSWESGYWDDDGPIGSWDV